MPRPTLRVGRGTLFVYEARTSLRMITFLPWLMILLGGIAASLDKPEEGQGPRWSGAIVGVVALLAVVGGAMSQDLMAFEFSPAWVAVVLLIGLAGWRPTATIGAVGLVGAIVASESGAVGTQNQTLYLHLALIGVAGLALVAGSSRSAAAMALTGFAGVSARFFLIPETSENVQMLPGALMLGVLVLGIVMLLVPKSAEKIQPWIGPGLGLVLAIVVFAIGAALFGRDHMPRTLFLSALAGAATAFAMPRGSQPDPVRVGLAGLVWLGIATFAFSNGLTLGMSLALIAGAGAVALTGSEASYAMMAPLFGLTGFRLARNIYPESTRALDLGQHYAVVGVFLAACAVMILVGAASKAQREESPRVTVSTVVGWTLAVLAILFSVMFLGAKGTTGLIVGIGLAPLLVQLGKADGAAGASLGVGLVGILGMAYPRLAELFETSRAEKQSAFVVAAAVGLALALFLVWLNRSPLNSEKPLETV